MKNFSNTINLQGKTYTEIIIDTCTLLRPQVEAFFKQTLIPALQIQNARLTISQSVLRETKYFSKELSERGDAARRAMRWLSALQTLNLIKFEGNPQEAADAWILKKIYISRAAKEKVLVITQDHLLASEIMRSNKTVSSCAPFNNVYRVNTAGYLEAFDTTKFYNDSSTKRVQQPSKQPDLSNILKNFGL